MIVLLLASLIFTLGVTAYMFYVVWVCKPEPNGLPDFLTSDTEIVIRNGIKHINHIRYF